MKARGPWTIAAVVAAILIPRSASAHLGSPDVFLDGQAGPYRVFVTVRPPHAVPGIADVEVLTTSSDIHDVRIVPLPLTGPGAQFSPTPDVATRSADDPRLFTGHLWMMTAGAWQVRVAVAGDRGHGNLSVPVPTLPQATLAMTRARRAVLLGLMLVLCTGFIVIVSAIAREARLAPGETPDRLARRRGRIAGLIATGVVGGAVFFGNWWWTAEASSYARYVYKPLELAPTLRSDGLLRLDLRDPGWIATRWLDDFVADHGHLMHLFIVSPELDHLWHLHPLQIEMGPIPTGTGTRTQTFLRVRQQANAFTVPLPDMPQGQYELFADVVHQTGLSETLIGQLDTPAIRGAALTGDDSEWHADGTSRSPGDVSRTIDGGRIVWQRDGGPLRTKQLTMFTFRVEDATGQPASDLEMYMGMPGHAIFVRRDRRVFAHVHPFGSAPMAAMEIATPSPQSHAHPGAGVPATVSFPYGFPEAGDYRIFVQVRRSERVVTGVFDAHVE